MPLRIWVIGTRTSSAPSGKLIVGWGCAAGEGCPAAAAGAEGAAGDGAGAEAGEAAAGAGAGVAPELSDGAEASWRPTAFPVRWLSTKSVTSSRVIRPPPPVPTIIAAVRPCSRSSRRTAGVIRASALPGSSCTARSSEPAGPFARGAFALGAFALAIAETPEAAEALPAPAPASADAPAGCFVSGSRVSSGAAAAASVGSAAALDVAVGSAVAVVPCVPAGALVRSPDPDAEADAVPVDSDADDWAAPASSITAISALFGTVAPSSTRISVRVPSNGDGTSALTLSVMTSRSGSYLA